MAYQRVVLINDATTIVENTFDWDEEKDGPYPSPEGYSVVVIDKDAYIGIGFSYDSETGVFTQPPPPPPPVLTPEQLRAQNQQTQDGLKNVASYAMAPVLVSLQLGDATDEETLLAKAWQTYYRALLAVDLTVENPDWPVPPDAT